MLLLTGILPRGYGIGPVGPEGRLNMSRCSRFWRKTVFLIQWPETQVAEKGLGLFIFSGALQTSLIAGE